MEPPTAKTIVLDLAAEGYLHLLGGPPDTVTMRSGLVVLDPGRSVGTHSTENCEEVLVVFEGVGELIISDGAALNLKGGMIAYCPPRTEHDVLNVGKGPLRYLYLVAKAE